MVFVPANDGRWVNENFARLAEVIHDYDPQFELRWIPPEHRSDPSDHERAFCVFDTYSNTPAFFASENSTAEDILTHLFDIDNKHGDALSRMEARNNAIEAIQLKAKLEEAEERQEYIAWLMQTEKNFINLGNGRVVDSQFRRIR